MNVLIDTSVWVAHFRCRSDALVELMVLDLALTHPMVIGELACGTPPAPRGRTLHDIGLLRSAALPTQAKSWRSLKTGSFMVLAAALSTSISWRRPS